MNTYIEKLKKYLTKGSACDSGDGEGLIDMLYLYYREDNPIENQKIKSKYMQLDEILSKLTLEDNDSIFAITVGLCEEYTKQAFLNGVEVRFRLFTDLEQ